MVFSKHICASLLLLALSLSLQAQYKVIHLEKPINTPGSETAATILGDTVLVFSSLQETSHQGRQFSFNNSITQVYQSRIARNGKIARPKLDRWGLNSKKHHTGNVSFDPYTKDIYFTRGNLDDLSCKIYFAKKLKRGWQKPVLLKGSVNLNGSTSTQPSVGRLPDSSVILYFVSDRPGGIGGMDIWYTIIKNGQSGDCVNLGPMVNSSDDDITPFYDMVTQTLYFSSNRSGGKGGHDIYYSIGARNTWQPSQPMCGCLNSEQNDIYFTITQHDSLTGTPVMGFLSSNRPDSYFRTDSSCCNDIYRWGIDTALILQRLVQADTLSQDIDTIKQNLKNFEFPLFLYFHNDEPDPRSKLTTTSTTYSQCQKNYLALREQYLSKQTTHEDSLMMTTFFDTCVIGNYQRIEQLFDYIESLLDAGNTISLNIAGYASPRFTAKYNAALSERRIASFVNMVHQWRGGIFLDPLSDGTLILNIQPHGAVEPTTESLSKDPVYGLPAAISRRIEILSCEVLERK